jgi:hypothetical protein
VREKKMKTSFIFENSLRNIKPTYKIKNLNKSIEYIKSYNLDYDDLIAIKKNLVLKPVLKSFYYQINNFLSKRKVKEYGKNLYGHFVTVKNRKFRNANLKWFMFYTIKFHELHTEKKILRGLFRGEIKGRTNEGKLIKIDGSIDPLKIEGYFTKEIKYAHILYISTPIGYIESFYEGFKKVDKNFSFMENLFFWKTFLMNMIKIKVQHVLFNLIDGIISRISKLFKSEILFYEYFFSNFKKIDLEDKLLPSNFMKKHFDYTYILKDINTFEKLFEKSIRDYNDFGSVKLIDKDENNKYYFMNIQSSLFLEQITEFIDDNENEALKLLKSFSNDIAKYMIEVNKLSNFGFGYTIFIVRKEDDVVVGTKVYKIKEIESMRYIKSIGTYIHSNERQKGYGKLLLEKFESYILSQNIKWVQLFPVESARYYWKNIQKFSFIPYTEYMIKDISGKIKYEKKYYGKKYLDKEYDAIVEKFKEFELTLENFKIVIEHANVNPRNEKEYEIAIDKLENALYSFDNENII